MINIIFCINFWRIRKYELKIHSDSEVSNMAIIKNFIHDTKQSSLILNLSQSSLRLVFGRKGFEYAIPLHRGKAPYADDHYIARIPCYSIYLSNPYILDKMWNKVNFLKIVFGLCSVGLPSLSLFAALFTH